MTEEQRPQRLDLAQFASVEDAISKVESARDYTSIAEEYIVPGELALPMLFFGSMINRCEGLHTGIAREMREANPQAVFPLIRTYAEAAALLIYVIDHIKYIEALIDKPQQRRQDVPARLKVGKLVSYAKRKVAPGFKFAYDELSDFTHFGSTAMWTPYVLDEDGKKFSWTSYPRWKSDEQALIAAAGTLEISAATHALLRNFGNRYLKRPRG